MSEKRLFSISILLLPEWRSARGEGDKAAGGGKVYCFSLVGRGEGKFDSGGAWKKRSQSLSYSLSDSEREGRVSATACVQKKEVLLSLHSTRRKKRKKKERRAVLALAGKKKKLGGCFSILISIIGGDCKGKRNEAKTGDHPIGRRNNDNIQQEGGAPCTRGKKEKRGGYIMLAATLPGRLEGGKKAGWQIGGGGLQPKPYSFPIFR